MWISWRVLDRATETMPLGKFDRCAISGILGRGVPTRITLVLITGRLCYYYTGYKRNCMARTSKSHPLYIDELPLGLGCIGLTICTGKGGDSVFGEPWKRDLELDLNVINDWGAKAVVTLVEQAELEYLEVNNLGDEVERLGMSWFHFPIPDLGIPNQPDMNEWRSLSPELHRILDQGGRVLIHCRGGLGRAGTIASLLLIERGEQASDAISAVRSVRSGAVETAKQVSFLESLAGFRTDRAEKIRASLFAGAMGDALGAEIEFWNLNEIRRVFPQGMKKLPKHDGRVGAITDDTQMTLFTAEGMVRAHVRAATKGICHPASVVHHALLRWYVTQVGRPQRSVNDIGLVADSRLNRRRAPGMTCMDALHHSKNFGDVADNDSKGCGTIMRVAPIAFSAGMENVEEFAMQTSALTHGHRTGQEAAAAWANILSGVLGGKNVEDAARGQLYRFGQETSDAIAAALAASRDGRAETVETLGAGWVAEEALSIALYAGLSAQNLEDGLRIAVTHSGDSDSTGAIAGNLLGLLYPQQTMAHRWRKQIECADLIDRLARDLAVVEHEEIMGLASWYPGW